MNDRAKAVPSFLVVDDIPAVARDVAQFLRPMGDVTIASSVAEAITMIGSRRSWTAAFIDLHLLDGKGTEGTRGPPPS